MRAEDYAARMGEHQASVASNLTGIAAKLNALALPNGDMPQAGGAGAALMTSYAYTAARNELAGLVKLAERALKVATHCEHPKLIGMFTTALVEARTARNDLIASRRRGGSVDYSAT
jgi:hypothetical protein